MAIKVLTIRLFVTESDAASVESDLDNFISEFDEDIVSEWLPERDATPDESVQYHDAFDNNLSADNEYDED